MRMNGWNFLIIPLGVLVAHVGLWTYSETGWAQDAPQNSPASTLEDPLQTETPVPGGGVSPGPAKLPPIPDLPTSVPGEIQPESEPGEPSPGTVLPQNLLNEPGEAPQGPTAEEEILAPLEAGPTAEEEILAPLEGLQVSGDTLDEVGPQRYTVQEGDTLWDITHTYFADSFLWPKIWKSNKTISNPDVIYPGNIILIPGDPGAPFVLLPEGAPTPAPTPGKPVAPQTAGRPAEVEKPGSSVALRRSRVEAIRPEVTSPSNFSLDLSALPNPGYVVTKENRVGKIVGAFGGREIIGEGETAYLRPKRGQRPEIGTQFTVYRIVRKVEHPKTGRNIGKLLRILGTVEVIGSLPKEKTLTAMVTDSVDYMRPGDLLMPLILKETATSVSYSTKPENPLEGFILEVEEKRIFQAQQDLVFLDRGRQHGLKIGNRFTIVRDGDRTSLFSPGRGVRLPSRTIGQLQVISVQDITSTARIIKSSEVILRGDRFETPTHP